MYAALWRALPGSRSAKSLEALGLFVAVVAVLFLWVFPAVSSHLPWEDVTVQAPTATPQGGVSTP